MNYRESLIKLIESQSHFAPTFGAEVGVHRGRTSCALLNYFTRLHLYLVDSWTVAAEATPDPMSRYTQAQQDEYYGETLGLVRRYGDRAEVLRMDSVVAVDEMQPLDLAFIDADHGYQGCLRDLGAYWNQLNGGGLLIGHDYGKEDLPGVTKAADEFARNRGVELRTADGNIYWMRKC